METVINEKSSCLSTWEHFSALIVANMKMNKNKIQI